MEATKRGPDKVLLTRTWNVLLLSTSVSISARRFDGIRLKALEKAKYGKSMGSPYTNMKYDS